MNNPCEKHTNVKAPCCPTDNITIVYPVEKKNYCKARFRCTAKNAEEQKNCLFFSVSQKHEFCGAYNQGSIRSCGCRKARENALNNFIEAVRRELQRNLKYFK